MNEVVLILVAIGFIPPFLMGLFAPGKVLAQFGVNDLPIDARNEARAVYGGMHLFFILAICASLVLPQLRAGVTLTIGCCMAGLVFGRVFSILIDRKLGKLPAMWLVLELIASGLLFASLLLDHSSI